MKQNRVHAGSLARRFLFLAIGLLAAASLSAWDVGGYLDNTTGLESAPGAPADATGADKIDLVQRTAVAAWLFHAAGSWTIEAQGSYVYTPSVPVLADLDKLTIGGLFPAEAGGARSLGFQAGRMSIADATGLILNHRLDGLQLSVGSASSAFSAVVGTSALMQLPTSAIVMSNLDVNALPQGSPTYSVFASPRLIGLFEYRARSLFAGQDVTVGGLFQEDLRSEDQLTPEFTQVFDPAGGGAMDTQYLTVMLSGGLLPGLYHRTYYTANTGRTLTYREDADSVTGFSYQNTFMLGHLAGLELTYFIPAALNSRIRASGLFSSGDADAIAYYDGNTNDMATAFVPISAGSFSSVFTLQPGNSAHAAISYSLRPLSGTAWDILQAEVSSVSYFRTSDGGPVSEGSVDAAGTEAYVGTDVDLKVVAQPFSDLRLVLSGGLFVPNKAAMTADNDTVDYQFAFQGVLRF